MGTLLRPALLVLVFIGFLLTASSIPAHTVSVENGKLGIYVLSQKLPADGKTYGVILIQVENDKGELLPSTRDIEVILASSDTTIGAPQGKAIISEGTIYAFINFTTTTTAGSTIVTASAFGFTAVSTQITTFAISGTPSKLAIFALPPNIPVGANSVSHLQIQLQDNNGIPVNTKDDVLISLSVSPSNLGTMESKTKIPAGRNTVTVDFTASDTPGTVTIVATSSGLTSGSTTLQTKGSLGTALAVFALPSTMSSVSSSGLLVIELLDSGGNPFRATSEIRVSVQSTNPSVATVQSTQVLIPAGQYLGRASINPTGNAGTATFTAATAGYSSASATVTTVAPTANPTKLALFASPTTLLADGTFQTALAVEAQDDAGNPAKVSSLISVTLESTNPLAGVSDAGAAIQGGTSHTFVNFRSTRLAGSATITALASGLSFAQTTLTTVGNAPAKVSLLTGASSLLADGQTYNALVVQLIDQQGNPITTDTGIDVSLSSSNPALGFLPSMISIAPNKDNSIVQFKTSLRKGTSTFTALAKGLTSSSVTLTTVTNEPSSFVLSTTQRPLLASNASYPALVIQLLDSSSLPKPAPSGVNFELTSSRSDVIRVPSNAVIPPGGSNIIVPFTTGSKAGTAIISVLAAGFVGASIQIGTAVLPMELGANLTKRQVFVNNETIVKLDTKSRSQPLSGVQFTIELNGTLVSSALTNPDGKANVTLKLASTGNFTVTVKAAKLSYASSNSTLRLSVLAPPKPVEAQTSTPTPSPTPAQQTNVTKQVNATSTPQPKTTAASPTQAFDIPLPISLPFQIPRFIIVIIPVAAVAAYFTVFRKRAGRRAKRKPAEEEATPEAAEAETAGEGEEAPKRRFGLFRFGRGRKEAAEEAAEEGPEAEPTAPRRRLFGFRRAKREEQEEATEEEAAAEEEPKPARRRSLRGLFRGRGGGEEEEEAE